MAISTINNKIGPTYNSVSPFIKPEKIAPLWSVFVSVATSERLVPVAWVQAVVTLSLPVSEKLPSEEPATSPPSLANNIQNTCRTSWSLSVI